MQPIAFQKKPLLCTKDAEGEGYLDGVGETVKVSYNFT